MKRHFCIFLAIGLMLFALPVSAEAERGEDFSCGQSLVWTFHDASATLTVTGEGEMTHYSPTYRAPWQKYDGEIEHIVIGEGVTGIGDFAFYRIYAQTVTFPSTLLSIGDRAFFESGFLTLDIPASVQTVGENAFALSENLLTVTMHDGDGLQIGASAFTMCAALETLILPHSPLTVGEGAFVNTAVRTLEISQGVTAVGEKAFTAMPLLESVRVAGSVKKIGARAFAVCDKLTRITLEEGVEEIGALAFAGYCQLKNVIFPDSLQTIGDKAFYHCSRLEQVVFGDRLSFIGDNAFAQTGLIEVYLPESVMYAPFAFNRAVTVYKMIGGQSCLSGDCDGDNALNALDLLLIQNRILTGETEKMTADVNLDGRVNILDMVRLKTLLADSGFSKQ